MKKTKKTKKTTKYPLFATICLRCNAPVQIVQFPVHIGGASFALCPKHLKEFRLIAQEFVHNEI